MENFVQRTLPEIAHGQVRPQQKSQGLDSDAAERELRLVRFPIPDGGVPPGRPAAVQSIVDAVNEGENVVMHCMGGLGRAGTIGAWMLVAAGDDVETALLQVRDARGPNAPETEDQRNFVRRFAER